MSPRFITPRLRRAVFGPVLVTGALAVLAAAAVAAPVVREGWLLAWLLLGVVAVAYWDDLTAAAIMAVLAGLWGVVAFRDARRRP